MEYSRVPHGLFLLNASYRVAE